MDSARSTRRKSRIGRLGIRGRLKKIFFRRPLCFFHNPAAILKRETRFSDGLFIRYGLNCYNFHDS
ncbi:hypothetical protein [Neisseria bacilliformis]|uniref:hypothetical protein n=1 Tax=Neisseria bacilliformis TaxID=267212 RepID=UPI000A4D494A|nr:hypothetical protein [Neisseria bacilliformis]